ncbi:hypothetical protein HYT05_05135, partial [Candidatus Kaiserbacteria bacterium]|nr:hypothetical protein [Candidatus Kaiserbacteria bacterium]
MSQARMTLAYNFKKASTTNTDTITVTWEGQVSVSTTTSLQIYNNTTTAWETLQTNSSPTAGSDFTLTGTQSTSLSSYYDGSNLVAVRAITGTTTQVTTLKTDQITITFTDTVNRKIRQEINILDGYLGAGTGSYATSSAIINIDTTKYSSPTYYFEVVASSSASLAIGTDGFPVVSYDSSAPNDNLTVAKCGNAACTSGNTITVVDNKDNVVSSDTSIAIGTDGFPVISYYDPTIDSLKVAKCNSTSCVSTSSPLAYLPQTAANYDTFLDDASYGNVASADDVYDSLFAATSSRLAYNFKKASTTNTDTITVTWEGQVSVSTTTSLQ